MKKLFVANEGFEKEYTRRRARGHKRLIISDDVEVVQPVTLHTDGTDLVVSRADDSDDSEVYTMLCKEFGLVGGATGFKNKISVIFCDNGWMLVTLLHGALVMNLDDQLLMPTAGDDFTNPKVVKEDICWVNADNLLEYGKYFGLKGQFMFDFEWVFTVSGDKVGGLRSFKITNEKEEDIDISLGYFAQYEQQIQNKKDAKEANSLMRNIFHSDRNSSYEFDEDEYDEDSYDEDDDDDLSLEDYGM